MALLRFHQRFPSLEITYLSAETMDEFERTANIRLPVWLRTMLEVQAGISPGRLVWARFEQFEHWSPHSDQLGDIWYQLGITPRVSSEYDTIFTAEHPLLIVASWSETLHSVLAIKAGDSVDQRVYEFNYDDILASGELPSNAARVVFNSYVNLFKYIICIKHEGETDSEVLVARDI